MREVEAGNAVEYFAAWPRPRRSNFRPTDMSDGQLIVDDSHWQVRPYVPLDLTTYNMLNNGQAN